MLKLVCLLVITVVGLSAVEADVESRINGGQNAVNGQFPHHARIRIVGQPIPFCGGSIIGDRFVLTITFCVVRDIVRNLRVLVGEVDNQANFTEYHVVKLAIHPEADGVDNDIAVVRVAQPFQFSANIRAIQLPTEDTLVTIDGSAVPATIVGWGQNKPDVSGDPLEFPRILQWVNTTAISHPECRRLIAQGLPSADWRLRENHICTRHRLGTAACGLDGGGGLITNGPQPVIIGILSVVYVGCPAVVPNFYSRVFPYLEFIRSAME